MYDPTLGRFLSADPFVQFADRQSDNRYSDGFNNPFGGTDPSGYSWWTKFRDWVLKPVVAATAAYFTFGAVSNAVFFAMDSAAAFATWNTTQLLGASYAARGAAAGSVGAAINTGGDPQATLWGAASGSLFGYFSAGTHFQNPIEQAGQVGNAIAEGRGQDLSRMAFGTMLNHEMGALEARAARRLGIRPEALDVGLLSLSALGNGLVGSRFREYDGSFEATDYVGPRGYGNRERGGSVGYVFDTVDAILAFQGKPTASLRDLPIVGMPDSESPDTAWVRSTRATRSGTG